MQLTRIVNKQELLDRQLLIHHWIYAVIVENSLKVFLRYIVKNITDAASNVYLSILDRETMWEHSRRRGGGLEELGNICI